MRPASLAASTAVVGAAAVASRVLGFARDILLAAMLGSGPAADAFVVAFRLPSLLRRILGEGGLNAGIVPVAQRLAATEGGEAAGRFAGESLLVVGLALFGLIVAAEIAAPWIVLALAPGFEGDAVRLGLATTCLRLTLPLVALSTLAALGSALLNARHRFAAAALAPLAVNAVLVGVLLVLLRAGVEAARLAVLLAGAVSLAGLAQLLLLVPALRRMPDPPRFSRPRLSPALRRAAALGLPGLAGMTVAQLGVVVAVQVASRSPDAVSRLYYADRLYQLPLGFVAAGAGVVLLPEIARRLAAGDGASVHVLQNRALDLALGLALPAAVALVLLATPIVSVLFERGAFVAQDTVVTARVLAALAVGLPAAALTRVLAQPFYAREKPRPPLLCAGLGLVTTALAALALEPAWGAPGVAAGVSAGAWTGALALVVPLRRRGWWALDAGCLSRWARTGLASALMGAGVWTAADGLSPWLSAAGLAPRVAALSILCLGGMGLYGALASVLGVLHWRDLLPRA